MLKLLPKIKIRVNDNIYIKDPDTSELGRKIISASIDLIHESGFENFTFRKLGSAIDTTETSTYRYFVSKHKLLLYLNSWYWSWIEYILVFRLVNIKSAEERLKRAITLVTQNIGKDFEHPYINLEKLEQIIVSELSKTYLTRDVDKENKEGAYESIMQVIDRLSELILELNPGYEHSHTLVSTILIGSLNQRFFAKHIPELTDHHGNEGKIGELYFEMALCSIKSKK